VKLLLSDLPETHELTAEWLERQLVGMELSQLVTELAAVHRASRPVDTVRTTLGNDAISRVLQRGLKELPQELLRKVMIQPFHLFELQELVFAYGGDYWRRKESELDLKQRVEADWRKLKAKLPVQTPLLPTIPSGSRWLVPSLVGVLLGAALGFVGCYLWLNGPEFPPKPRTQASVTPPPPVVSNAWGWNKPDAVTVAATPQAYLERLATLAEEWKTVVPSANTPNRKLQILIRLLELRAGCTRLSETNHPIPAEQQKKLKETALKWCEEIDVLTQNTQKVDDITLMVPFIEQFLEKVIGELRSGRATSNP